jgi:hypothetical protein
MQVVIPKEKLEALRACDAYTKSPEWNGEALVYSDWDATVIRLMSTGPGITFLGYLVKNELVPMTKEEFKKARAKHIFKNEER